MNKRLSVFFNFFAFNLLFFALYLNFIYKDVVDTLPVLQTVPVEVKSTAETNSIQRDQVKKADAQKRTSSHSVIKKDSEALRLSMN
jgi:hypothetical protein